MANSVYQIFLPPNLGGADGGKWKVLMVENGRCWWWKMEGAFGGKWKVLMVEIFTSRWTLAVSLFEPSEPGHMNGKPSSLSCVWKMQMYQNPQPAAKSSTCFHELIEPTIGRATHTRSYKGLGRRKYIAIHSKSEKVCATVFSVKKNCGKSA